jgi:hypothetical protein
VRRPPTAEPAAEAIQTTNSNLPSNALAADFLGQEILEISMRMMMTRMLSFERILSGALSAAK